MSDPAQPAGSSRKLLFALVMVLAALAGGLGAWLLIGGTSRPPAKLAGPVEPRPGTNHRPVGGRPTPIEPVGGQPAPQPEPAPAVRKLSPEVRAAVDRFKDTKTPVEERLREIDALARKAGAQDLEVLMALGDEKTYLNWAGVKALGDVPKDRRTPEIADYLRGKTADPDARIICEALRSLARQAREAAVPAIVAALERNQVRPDGFQGMVQRAAVEALAETGSANIVGPLVAQLNRSEERGWDMEYGSAIVKVLRSRPGPESKAALNSYADRLTARVPEDKMAGEYFRTKIAEARAAAGR
jgi:hypothetical protein